MRIIRLEAENIKRLKAIEIEPDENVVEISGRNSQGKTSALDCISMALGGKKEVPEKPIRNGETEAKIVLDLGDGKEVNIRVVRTFQQDKLTKLKVFRADGAEQEKPQQILDSLFGKLSFDPLAFARMGKTDPKKQRDMLLQIVGLEHSLLDMDVRRSDLYDKRRDIGRDVTRLKGELAGLPKAEKPDQEIEDVETLSEELQKAVELDSQIAIRSHTLTVETEFIKTAEETLAESKSRVKELEAWLDDKERPDIASIKERMKHAQEAQHLVEEAKRHSRVQETLKQADKQYGELTGEIESFDRKKAKMLREAQFPIEKLGIGFESVMYNGLPLEQAADSEKLKVSMSIAMAMNPKLRVVRITDGSLLDKDNMNVLAEMAAEKDYQVWIERVDPSSPSAIIIEDGMVKGENR